MTCDPLTGLGVRVNFALLGESHSGKTEVQFDGKVNICGALKHFIHTELGGMCSPLANELLQANEYNTGVLGYLATGGPGTQKGSCAVCQLAWALCAGHGAPGACKPASRSFERVGRNPARTHSSLWDCYTIRQQAPLVTVQCTRCELSMLPGNCCKLQHCSCQMESAGAR